MKTYNLGQLQRAYFVAELEKESNVDAANCLYCWKSSCGCDAPSVKDDPFLNMPNENEVLIVNEVQFA
jgi:hypothetical protein